MARPIEMTDEANLLIIREVLRENPKAGLRILRRAGARGGNIRILRLMSQVRQEFGIPEPLRPTVSRAELRRVEELRREEALKIGEGTDWFARHELRKQNQQLLRKLELESGQRIKEWADKALELTEPYLELKTKVVRREDPCPSCGAFVPVEELHVHPAKIDAGKIISGYKEAFERIRCALGMPKNYNPLTSREVETALENQLEQLNAAFRDAFRDAIVGGQLEQSAAESIWNAARLKSERAYRDAQPTQ